MKKEKKYGEVTPEALKKLEAEYPTIKVIELDPVYESVETSKGVFEEVKVEEGVKAVFRKPDRAIIKLAMNKLMKMDQSVDMISGGEVILHNCWLLGDERIDKDDKYYFRAAQELNGWINEIAGFTKG